jgi:AraC-like DNA-binding protein
MVITAFCVDDLPTSARLPAWRAELTAFAIEPRVADGELFSGRVDRFDSTRGVGFSIVGSGPQRLGSLSGSAGDIFWLSMVLEGAAALDLDDDLIELAPGDILFGKRGTAGTLEARTRFRMLNVSIPADMLTRASLIPLPTHLLRLRAGTGINAVLGAFLTGVAASLGRLDDQTSFAVEGALMQLVINCLFDDTGAVALGGLASSRAALLRRVWQSIEAKLGDSDLGLAQIAAEHRLSVRYIQQLFEENGQSFRAYLRKRRLARCCEDLANPLNANLSITQICLHRGFGDSASFSRAFRESHNCTPSEFRIRARSQRHDPKARLRGVTLNPA